MSRKWRAVRQDALRQGRVDERRIQKHKERLLAEVRPYKLAQIRNA